MHIRACESPKLQSVQLLAHRILNMLYNITASEKKYLTFRSLKKEKKTQRYMMYLTSSKVVKETLVSFEPNYEIDAS